LLTSFYRRDSTAISRFCLPPLARDFKNRIAARGPLKMDWQLRKFRSARVVSHRAVSFGEDQPDTAIRQMVVRLASTQKLTMMGASSKKSLAEKLSTSRPAGLTWVPDEAKQLKKEKAKDERVDFADNGKEKNVVEYLVLQRRVIRGTEEGWKVWGFAPESTPERIVEDAEYWRKTLNAHAGAA
jgi:protein MBA1